MKDFFGSISYPEVWKRAFPGEYFPPAVRTLMAVLCCYEGYLPQGSPASPCISNLVMKDFDGRMGDSCSERKLRYSRYCDDMTFSGDFEPGEVIRQAESLLYPLGMTLNRKKTGVYGKWKQHLVTGAVVNEKVQAPKEYRRKLRQECYQWLRFEKERDRAALPRLLGKVNYVLQLNPEDGYFQRMKQELKREMNQGGAL